MITLISGWATSSQCWTPLIEALKDIGSIQTVDWYKLFGSDEALIDTSVCIGWSIGGVMALQAAQKYQFEKCVLISTTPRQIEDDNFSGANLEMYKGLGQGIQYAREETLKQFCTMNLHPTKEHFDSLYEQALTIDQESLIKGLQFLEKTDLRKELSLIECPSLVLHGTQDAITPFTSGEYLSSHLPNAKFIPIEGAGHALPITHPKEIAAHIEEFLGGTHS